MRKQKLTTFLFITLLFTGINCLAQKHTTIVFRYNQDSIKQDSYYRPLCKISGSNSFGESENYTGKLISFNKKKDYSETIYDYMIKDTACAIIGDGLFGHETIVVPGDSMFLYINGITLKQINDQYRIPWQHNFAYEGKNKYVYSLFDSLAFVAGDLRFNNLSYKPSDKLDAFCEKANSKYSQQLSFLELYCNRHNIGIQFKELAKAEIYGAYIDNLLSPLNNYDSLTTNNYPKRFRETLLSCKFNDQSLYFKTSIYSGTAYEFSALILPTKRVSKRATDSNIKLVYETIKLNYPDSIRNHLQTSLLSHFLGNPQLIYPCIDSLITDFKSICKNSLYTHYLDSLFIARKALGTKIYSFNDAMSSQIVDTKDQLQNVKQLFKKKPLLIICWASWCGPCLKEIPSEKAMQNIYGDKVDFVYLSFDKSKKLWKDKLQTLAIKGDKNYLLTNYFNSDLANFYKINSIPFYLLYDKNGKKVETKDLRPSDNEFKKVLDKLIL